MFMGPEWERAGLDVRRLSPQSHGPALEGIEPGVAPRPPTHTLPRTDSAEARGDKVTQAGNRPWGRGFGPDAPCMATGPGTPEHPGEAWP